MQNWQTSLVAGIAGLACAMPARADQMLASREEGLEFPAEVIRQEVIQEAAVPPAAPPVVTHTASNTALNLTAATSLARLALIDLRGIQNPTPDDFAFCGLLLRQASLWDPGNAQVLRARVEAAHGAGDEGGMLAATRDLVKADPLDTVAQLRLISNRLARMQTAQERMAAYQQFLGAQGARLDPSIRSRLALDAALLARELGDEKAFVTHLKRATTLDGTNKDAALLAMSYFSESVADRAAHFELLANLLYADPLDAGVMTQVRDELASAGAWDQASRFHKVAVGVLASRDDLSAEDRLAELGLTWHMKGPGEVKRLLDTDLATMRERQKQLFERKTSTMEGGFDVRKPEDIRLSVPLDQLRLAAALTIDNPDAAEAVVTDLVATNVDTSAVLADPSRRPASFTGEDADRKSTELKVELAVWRMLANQGVEEVVASAPALREALGEDDDLAAILDAWVALRSGRPDDADRIARESGVASGWLGVAAAMVKESKNDKPGAAALLRSVAEDEPLTALGCYARSRAKSLDPAFTSPLTAKMDRMARDIPLWVDSMIARPMQHQRLLIDLEKRDARALEPMPLTIRLKNLAPIPLSLGADLAINARTLVIPTVRTGEEELIRWLSADVVMLDQRLRLMPNEELSLRYDPAVGSMGWVTGTACTRPITEKYRVLQGFTAGEGGTRAAGPGCLDVTSSSLARDAYEPARWTPDALALRVATADEVTLVKFAVATRALVVPAQMSSSIDDLHDRLAQAWAARYATLSPQCRAIVLCELPPASEVMAMKPVDDAAAGEQDPLVLPAYLATRVGKVDDPALDRIGAVADADLARLAALQRARLTADARVYARQGMTAGLAASREQGGR
jgi:hypothetical protein